MAADESVTPRPRGRYELPDLSVYESLTKVNYRGCVYPTYYALPHRKHSRGQIVAVSSLAGITGVPSRTGYADSKHAVFGFFDSLRIGPVRSATGGLQ